MKYGLLNRIENNFNCEKIGSAMLVHADCNDVMGIMNDNEIGLVCSDPPYGIDICNQQLGKGKKLNIDHIKFVDVAPTVGCLAEMQRVSDNQIIWGGNYFDLPPTRCNLIWDKMQKFSGADFELAWTNFNKPSKAFRMSRIAAYKNGTIHPTQKPVALYRWLFENYAQKDRIILDTHAGSFSSAIAAHMLGIDYIGCEVNAAYYSNAIGRVKAETSQMAMFC